MLEAHGSSKRDLFGLRSCTRPGGGARHVSGGELDPHEPGLLRADEHGVWRAVPATGDRRHLSRPRRLATDHAARREADVRRRARGRPGGDVTARREPVLHRRGSPALRDAPARDDQPGDRVRADRAGAQHVRRGVLPSRSGPRRPLPERVAGPRDGAGAGPGGGVPRSRAVVGAAGRRRRPDRGPDRRQPGPAARRREFPPRRGRGASGRDCPPVLGLRRFALLYGDRRDDERQLGDAVHDRGPRRVDDAARPSR